MTVPPTRTPVRIARGSYANLTTVDALASLAEGELAFATDTDQLYVKKGAVLVPVSSAGGGGDFSGDYNDLTNKPDIPSATSDLTNDSGFITAADVPPAYDDTALAGRVTTNEADIAQLQTDVGNIDSFSGDYNDLTNKPSIPSTPGDIGAATATQGALAESALQPGANISELTNDAGYITSADIPGSPVLSVNGETGEVVLDAADVGAIAPGEVNPVYFANQAAFPDANTNHGAVAHSHADGAMFFAHGGTWNRLANSSEIPPVNNLDLASLDPLP